MKRNFLFLIIYISTTILAQNNDIDYYPLNVGFEWKYKAPNKDWEEKFVVVEYDHTYDAYLIKQIIKLGDLLPIIKENLIEKRNGKVLLLGTRGGALESDWAFASNIVILESNLEVGQHWKTEAPNGVIEEYRVKGFSELSVPAGNFKDVLIIDKTIKYTKEEPGIITREYYAPNIGLIKKEVLTSNNTYEIFTELVGYKK